MIPPVSYTHLSKDVHPEGEESGTLVMTDYEYNKLKAAYDETMSRTGEEEEFGQEEYLLYGSYEPLTAVSYTHLGLPGNRHCRFFYYERDTGVKTGKHFAETSESG